MNSYLSIFFFILITLGYFYFGKLKTDLNADEGILQSDYKTNMMYLLAYFILVLISQILLNVLSVSQLCGGSVAQNIASGTLLAFIPWFFIFGVVIGVLIIFPGLKTVFTNVIGYFSVSGKAGDIINNLLINDTTDEVNKINDNEEKLKLRKTADTIIKICSNKSVLINELNPLNFKNMFSILEPLIKTSISSGEKEDLKKQLYDLVILKDNIGEFCWYVYAGIFISSIVNYNTISKGCVKSIQDMKNNYSDYQKQSEEIKKQSNTSNQIYNVT
jgi:hypothetical protein